MAYNMNTKTKVFLLILSLVFYFSTVKISHAKEPVRIASAVLLTSQNQTNKDQRAVILKQFLKQYNSPLAKHADTFVKEADEHNLDWKFLVAISGVESTFAQQLPYNSYNAWGWGIYGDNCIYFKSYDEAIETISKDLREKYMDKWGAKDVYQIGRFYAASPTWSQRVVGFMEKIDKFALDNPEYHLLLSI